MKVVTWNCNGAFRKKYSEIVKIGADLYVIQECESPEKISDPDFHAHFSSMLWTGDSINRGLGVFATMNTTLEQLTWPDIYEGKPVKHFLPCLVNGAYTLVAIWTHRNNSPTFGYIGQLWKYLQVNKHRISDKSLLVGDFNSNPIWDKPSRHWNHSDVVRELESLQVLSLYHTHFEEDPGMESMPTLYLQRNLEKPYHIDYLFGSDPFVKNLKSIDIGNPRDWLSLSDHMPICASFT